MRDIEIRVQEALKEAQELLNKLLQDAENKGESK